MKLPFRHFITTALSIFSVATAAAIVDGTTTFESLPISWDDKIIDNGSVRFTDIEGWDLQVYSPSEGKPVTLTVDEWFGTKSLIFYVDTSAGFSDLTKGVITPTQPGLLFDLLSVSLTIDSWNVSDVPGNFILQGIDAFGQGIAGASVTRYGYSDDIWELDLSGINEFRQIAGFSVRPEDSDHYLIFVSIDDITVANVSAIPEPSTVAALMGAAVLGIAAVRKRRNAFKR
jgi:hypothetical protein